MDYWNGKMDNENQVYIIMVLYNYLLKNWKFCKSNVFFYHIIVRKWKELHSNHVFQKVSQEINPHFEQWNKFFEGEMKALDLENENLPEEKN